MQFGEPRPAIPEAIKRAVRQRYRFGCAACGLPVFDYDHIDKFSDVKVHEESNLILLCPKHHAAKTRGRLSDEMIRHYAKEPFNKERTFTSGYDIDKTQEIKIKIATNTLFWKPVSRDATCHVIWISGDDYFVLHRDDGWITFSILVTDIDGKVLLSVNRGELQVATSAWDYEYVGSRLIIRDALRSLLVDLELSNDRVTLHAACFVSGGLGWKVADGWIHTIGAKGGMISIGGTAHIESTEAGMFGLTNDAVYRVYRRPGFCWHMSTTKLQPGYIWTSSEDLARLRQGNVYLVSLLQHWREQAHPRELSRDLEDVSRGFYFANVTANEHLYGPAGSSRIIIDNINAFFGDIVRAFPDKNGFDIQAVTYVPAQLVDKFRLSDFGKFVESDRFASLRNIRLIIHAPKHGESGLHIKSNEIARLMERV